LMAIREFHIELTNNAMAIVGGHPQPVGVVLTKVDEKLCQGGWSDGLEPPAVIGAGMTGVWQSESQGWLRGTEGFGKYEIADINGELLARLSISWHNPYDFGHTRVGSLLIMSDVPFDDDCDIAIPTSEIEGQDLTSLADDLRTGFELLDSHTNAPIQAEDAVAFLRGEVSPLTALGGSGIDPHPQYSFVLRNRPGSFKEFSRRANFDPSRGVRWLSNETISLRRLMWLRDLS